MRQLTEVIDERNQLVEKMQKAVGLAEQENRQLNDTETSFLDGIKERIEALDAEQRDIETQINNTNVKNTEHRAMKNFNLLSVIQNKIDGRANDAETQAFLDCGRNEMRSLGIAGDINIPSVAEYRELVKGTDASGGYDVPTELMPILTPLYNNSVLSELGCEFLNLQHPVEWPAISKSNISVAGEVAESTPSGNVFSKPLKLDGVRLTAYCDISNTLLRQASDDLAAVIVNDLGEAVKEKIESLVLSDTSVDGKLVGLFCDAEDVSDGITFADIMAADASVEEQNASVKGFAGSPSVKATLRSTLRDSSNAASGYIMPTANELDGRPFKTTNAAKGLLCGDFSNLVIAQFGGASLTIDSTSRAIYNETRIVINTLIDFGTKRPTFKAFKF